MRGCSKRYNTKNLKEKMGLVPYRSKHFRKFYEQKLLDAVNSQRLFQNKTTKHHPSLGENRYARVRKIANNIGNRDKWQVYIRLIQPCYFARFFMLPLFCRNCGSLSERFHFPPSPCNPMGVFHFVF